MKPVIGISLYNRYKELIENLKIIKSRFHEFKEEPSIVICWARYDEEKLDVAQRVINNIKAVIGENSIATILFRNGLIDEGKTGSTYPESHNIYRLREKCPENSYLIFQDADVYPMPGIYEIFDYAMNKDFDGVFFSMDNVKCVQHSCDGLFESKIFCIKRDSPIVFPVLELHEPNIMEWHIGTALRNTKRPFYVLYDYVSPEVNGLFFKARD